jgi:glycosidase
MFLRTSRTAAAAGAILLTSLLAPLSLPATEVAAATPIPTSVTITGSLQSELGCPGDWDPGCATTHLTYDVADDVWQGTFMVPAGAWEYKAALNGSWDENYGANAQAGGSNLPLNLAAPTAVTFFYDHGTHWITDDVGSIIATAVGSFQSELGCPGDWQPDCLRSWLQDPDGDGAYTFRTTALPPGAYEAKVAIDQAWSENYGAGGVAGGSNIPFVVAKAGQPVTFSWDSATKVLTITPEKTGYEPDDDVAWDGLRHDSRDTLYRTPGGAVPAGTPVVLRFRTFHNDVTGVKLRTYSLDAAGQKLIPMTLAASDASCYQEELADETCDYWEATLPNAKPDNLWYRFTVTDGTRTVYYADDTSALDGGLGRTTDTQVDNSWALMVHAPGFTAPAWARDAVIYQVFPDRFRNGRKDNDPRTGDRRYDDPVVATPWGSLPEGYCRNYADDPSDTTCPWRYPTPEDATEAREQPRGRDYQGGDLKGLDQQLDALKALGVTTIYLNPIFDAGSNHSYDTQDYTRIDPYFGTQKDFDNLVKHARQLGMRIVLDGVFNHMSSDSPIFDRYGHYPTLGACESADSPYRKWFTFRAPTATEPKDACAPSTTGGDDTFYDGWFGFDSIPVLNKSVGAVQDYFVTGNNPIATRWLKAGAAGWRMDVMGDASFPAGYWEDFREVVKAQSSEALIISETWQKDSTLLRMIRGDRADTTMNYRLRDAVLGLLTPGPFDSKGFADSGRSISPTEFANRIASIREDYPDAALYTAMNLLDSHDTERIAWTLTPGPETRAGRESDAANVAAGKRAQQLASLIQFSMPGAPTVYYGDEVGMTGDDDPDDRRAYPWADLGGTPDTAMRAHYASLARARSTHPVLRDGDLRMLLADDAAGSVAIGRANGSAAAITVVNRSTQSREIAVPVAGYLPEGTALASVLAVGGSAAGATVADGQVAVTVPARGGVLLAALGIDRTPPDVPQDLRATSVGPTSVTLAWEPVAGAAGYDVFVSPVTGGGYVRVNEAPVTGSPFTVEQLAVGTPVFLVVRARDGAGNLSGASNEVQAVPRYAIGWANLQWPPTMAHTISATDRTDEAYGQVWIDGVTNQPGATPTLRAQLGYGPDGSDPEGHDAWTWVDAAFNVDAGNNDEFKASLRPEATGTFDYAYRYSTDGGVDWVYADLDGIGNGYSPAHAGSLTVVGSADTTAPATPGNLAVTGASPSGITLAWDPVDDPTLFGYEVTRSTGGADPFVLVGRSSTAAFTDTDVVEGDEYAYRVRAVDTSFNRSADSASVTATAARRTVTLTFTVTVPASTDGTGRAVHIAGFLDRLDGGLPQWDPEGTALTRVDETHWAITLTGRENTAIEYKYALGSWDYVEKDGSCGEIGNRQLTLTYGTTGTQAVNDTVLNWRNVAPCGN